ncbi:CRO1 protein [Amniculicola lignicola CBS 123094]|uniref:CRO1 protein n=1 Tax=Amniculicola lignicola CBS 123094 TaxID=1392246 RepID=A0A6A5WML4_9PLEO|nr:CRO1 protein [Amniculicola lignicola CBS 123094]
MATTTEEIRAVDLARQASESTQSGKLSDAARFLREASSLAPEHAQVRAAWMALKEKEEESPLLGVCKQWVKTRDEGDGEKALRLVKGQSLSTRNAAEAFDVLGAFKGEDDVLDHVTGELLKNPGAMGALANNTRENPTQTYYELFERGDDSIDGLLNVCMHRAAWEKEEDFVQAHRDVFMLSLAMMMEEALEHPERAMKGVSTLLVHHADDLKGIVDADCFDVILASLDIRLPQSLRSQATVATIQLLQLSQETAEGLISKFVTSRVQRATADDLIIAFSAAAAIFPMRVQLAAQLFLTEGFVTTLAPMVVSKKSTKLEQAALELISSACVDKLCREAVNRDCREWLEDTIAAQVDKKRAGLAALILVKIGDEPAASDGPQIMHPTKVDQDDLISQFKTMVLSKDTSLKPDSIEGLAYLSLQPKVREDLTKTTSFLPSLIRTMRDSVSANQNLLFGALTIFVNLTTYLPLLSEEEKKMAQLKAYANTKKPSEPDPFEDDEHTTARCKKALDSGIVPFLVENAKRASPSMMHQTLQIILNLSKAPPHRGTLAQQGAVKLLIHTWDRITTLTTSSDSVTASTNFPPACLPLSAQALARILISINPAHIFSTAAALPSTSAIRPLISLLYPAESTTWQLHAFESLLALTNLASLDTPTQNHILSTAFAHVTDELLLSNNTMVRRAATELVCNLMASPLCVAQFADGTKRAGQRLHILLAMTDIDDLPTRSAAGGALAMLLGFDEGVQQLLLQDKGVDFLLELCRDEDEDVKYRGVVCVRSVLGASGEIGREGVKRVRGRGGVDVLKGVLREGRRREIVELGVETLKILMGTA